MGFVIFLRFAETKPYSQPYSHSLSSQTIASRFTEGLIAPIIEAIKGAMNWIRRARRYIAECPLA